MSQQNPAGSKKEQLRIGILVTILIVVIAAAVIFYSMSGWSAPARARRLQNPVPPTSEAIGAGMMVYMDHCQDCHGGDGNGKGKKAEQLSVEPANFTDPKIMSRATDGELFWKISEGHLPMPPFKKKLSEEERWQVVDYIRTFAAPPAPAKAETPHQP